VGGRLDRIGAKRNRIKGMRVIVEVFRLGQLQVRYTYMEENEREDAREKVIGQDTL
jgi:hypothetical protein